MERRYRAGHMFVGLVKSVFQRLALAHAVQNIIQLLVSQFIVLDKPLDFLFQSVFGMMVQVMERQGHMPFLEIRSRRFAQLLAGSVVIHQIVHQLKRHPEMIAEGH